MQMMTQPVIFKKSLYIVAVYCRRLKRAKSDAEISRHFVKQMYYDFDAVHILDISVINIAYKSLLCTVQSGIDACKYQFLKACSDKALCFFEDF